MRLRRYVAEALTQLALTLDVLLEKLLVSAELTAPAMRLRYGGDPYRSLDDFLEPSSDLDVGAWTESWRDWQGETIEIPSVAVWMTCPRMHVWEAWVDAVASHGTVHRPKWCPSCGDAGEVVVRDQQGGER